MSKWVLLVSGLLVAAGALAVGYHATLPSCAETVRLTTESGSDASPNGGFGIYAKPTPSVTTYGVKVRRRHGFFKCK